MEHHPAQDPHADALGVVRRRLRVDGSDAFLPVLCLLRPDTTPPPELWTRVDDVATRPVSRAELLSRVASLLDARRLSIELQRRGDRLERMGSVLAHDIRNPLAVAEGYVDRAAETGDVEHLGSAVDALGRIDRLIEDVLALAREGASSLDVETVDLTAVARSARSSVELGDATVDLPDGPVPLDADAGRLRELLENLFRNAVEHGGADVTVTVGPLDDGFYVADDGPGVPEAERERIFERSYTTGGGTGLGLAIVARVAEVHGWTVDVTEGSRGGARFEVTGCAVDAAEGGGVGAPMG
ncbi:MAG: sensor histidine kinase [Haloferacaceae archaeon]